MTDLAPGTHVVYPNPLAPWCSHRGVVYDVNRDGTYDVKSYSGLDVLSIPLGELHVVPVPTGPVDVGTHLIAMSVEYPPDMAPDPYARHTVGVVVSIGPTHVVVRPDQRDEDVEEFPANSVFAIPAAQTYVPRDGDEVFLSGGGDRSDEVGRVEPVHGNVLAVSASGEALVLTVLGQKRVDPALLALDDRVEPGTWVVLSDGEAGAVTRCDFFRANNGRHAWGYTVASPSGYSQEFKVWSGETFDGFLVASIESERIPSTMLPLRSTGQVTVYPVRT